MPDLLSVVSTPDAPDEIMALEGSSSPANPHALPPAIAAAGATGLTLSTQLVRRETGELVGCWPFALRRAISGQRILKTPLVPLYDLAGGPLVTTGNPAAIVDAMLDHLAKTRDLPRVLVLRNLQADGPVWQTLEESAARGAISIDVLDRWERALLDRSAASDAETYLAQGMSSGSRKRLRSKRKALDEGGKLTLDVHFTPEAIEAAFGRFMVLEVSGWKGGNGSALQQKPADAAYVLNAIKGLAIHGRAFIAEMKQGERAIASGLFLRCGSEVFFWKTAYDDSLAKQSPGVVFDVMLTEWLYTQDWFERLDTGSDSSVDPATLIWKQRRPMTTLVVSLDPGSLAGKTVAAAFRMRAALKRLKSRF